MRRIRAFVAAIEQSLPYIPGEMLVHFKEGRATQQQLSALSVVNNDVSALQMHWIGETALITGLPFDDSEHQAALLRLQPEVDYAYGPDLATLPPRFDRYVEMPECGTSMAAPHVAGAAALLYSQGIREPAAIEAALEKSAVDLGAPGKDMDFGYGLIDVRAALLGLGVTR